MEIQKNISTFTNSEKSEKKKSGSKDSEYQFTPGWKICESIRAEMDKHGIMMPISVIKEEHQMVEYPVYKMLNGTVVSFIKKELLSTVTVEYSWVDTDTGDVAGPFQMITSGANGIDKSNASALSAAERYIFLKFFHIPTKDKGIELDSHDSSTIPGFREQPMNATDSDIAAQKAQGSVRMIPPVPQPIPQTQPSYGKEYQDAVNAIAMFARGTKSHTDAVNRQLEVLSMSGYPVSDRNFVDTLVSIAEERRNKNSK